MQRVQHIIRCSISRSCGVRLAILIERHHPLKKDNVCRIKIICGPRRRIATRPPIGSRLYFIIDLACTFIGTTAYRRQWRFGVTAKFTNLQRAPNTPLYVSSKLLFFDSVAVTISLVKSVLVYTSLV